MKRLLATSLLVADFIRKTQTIKYRLLICDSICVKRRMKLLWVEQWWWYGEFDKTETAWFWVQKNASATQICNTVRRLWDNRSASQVNNGNDEVSSSRDVMQQSSPNVRARSVCLGLFGLSTRNACSRRRGFSLVGSSTLGATDGTSQYHVSKQLGNLCWCG